MSQRCLHWPKHSRFIAIQGRVGNIRKKSVGFHIVAFFSDRTIISKPLDDSLSCEQKSDIMNWRRTVLGKVKEYINDKLYPQKVNVIDPSRENYQAPPTIKIEYIQ